MSLKHHNAQEQREPMSPSQLAHELNNLLDGSIRSVGIAMRELKQLSLETQHEVDLLKRLYTADRSMHHMADVIERYANGDSHESSTSADMVNSRGTLLDVLTHAVNVYGPTIEQHGIELVTRLDPQVADLSAGPAYTVLANGINNAIQAINRGEDQNKTKRISVCLMHEDHLVAIQITDTGPGFSPKLFSHGGKFRFGVTTRPGGHGVGLGVCQQIARDLDGELELTANPEGGASLTLRYPRSTASTSQSGGGEEGQARRAG